MSQKKIAQLMKAYEVADKNYDYEGGEHDQAYENNDHESEQHDENCDWIYDNCNCHLSNDSEYDY